VAPDVYRGHTREYKLSWTECNVVYCLVTPRRTRRPGVSRRPSVTKRTVQLRNCDDDDNIRAQDDQTLVGKIVVQDCPCERRFANNATRLANVAATVTKQLRAYFQKLYSTNINYDCNVRVEAGNKTHTVFAYAVKVPKSDHDRARAALKKTCKDAEVSQSDSFPILKTISS
jgi:hypothetical protein